MFLLSKYFKKRADKKKFFRMFENHFGEFEIILAWRIYDYASSHKEFVVTKEFPFVLNVENVVVKCSFVERESYHTERIDVEYEVSGKTGKLHDRKYSEDLREFSYSNQQFQELNANNDLLRKAMPSAIHHRW